MQLTFIKQKITKYQFYYRLQSSLVLQCISAGFCQ